jgi:Uma2 family endonuclease
MATTALVTVNDFLRVPEPKEGHYELHHGELVLMPPPKAGHQRLQERLREILASMLRDRKLVVRVEMAFRPAPEYEVWKADVGILSEDRERSTPDDAYLEGAPELVIEVLSPGNTVDEIEDKMHVCLGNGCYSFWVVDQKRKEIRVTRFIDMVTKRYTVDELVPLAVIPASLPVRKIFDQ